MKHDLQQQIAQFLLQFVVILRLAFFLAVLGLSVMGFTRALFGETWRIPYLDELAERIPFGN